MSKIRWPIPSNEGPKQHRVTTVYFALPAGKVIDDLTNSATSTQTILSSEASSEGNSGTGTHTTSDSLSEIVAQPEISDSFSRSVLGENWSLLNSVHSSYIVTSNELQPQGSISSAYWNNHKNLTDVEVYVTLQTLGSGVDIHDVVARIQEPGGIDTWDGYSVQFEETSSQIVINKYTNGTSSPLVSSPPGSFVLSNGDKIKIRVYGNVIEAWATVSGSDWKLAARTTDSSYVSGYVGLVSINSNSRLDNFVTKALSLGAGDQTLEEQIVTPASSPPKIHYSILAPPRPERKLVTEIYFALPVPQLEITDTLTNSAESTQSILSAEAQAANNAGSATHTVADATAEVVSNSANSTQAILESIAEFVTNSATSSQTIDQSLADSPANVSTSTQTITTAESQAISNSATSSQTILSSEAQAANNAGTASHTTADSTAETVTQINNEGAYGSGEYGEGGYGEFEPHTILEAIAESLLNTATSIVSISDQVQEAPESIENTGTSTQTLLSAEAQAANNAGTGSHTTADATAETNTDSSTNSQTLLEFTSISENITNIATSEQTIAQALAESTSSSGTGTQVTSEATADDLNNTASSTNTQLEAEAQEITNSGTASHTILEDFLGRVEEELTNEATSIHTLGIESELESNVTTSTSTHSILTAEADSPANSSEGASALSDATAEMIANMATALYSLEDQIHVSIFEVIDAPGYHMQYEFVSA